MQKKVKIKERKKLKMLNEMKSRLLSGKKKVLLLVCGLILLPVLAFAQYTGGSYDGYCMELRIAPGDTVPPSPVTDLQILDSLYNFYNVKLGWTAPYDSLNALRLYDIRYSTSSINENNWDAADTCTGEPIPQPPGSTETFVVQGLLHSTHYYFALKTEDTALNWSDISNCVDVTTSDYDSIPPAPVTDLQVTEPTGVLLTLRWTATGDDSTSGTASYYDIRYSTSAISESNWAVAVQCTDEPLPQPPGSTETFIAGGLSGNTTYYFALKTADEQLNWSGISNCASGTTEAEVEMELIYDDLLKDGSYLSISPSAKYFVRFHQYPVFIPYSVEGFAAYLRGYIGKDDKQYPEVPDIIEGSMSCFRDSSKDEVRAYSIFLYPDDGQGLPDTTAILDSTELTLYAGRWNYYPFDNCIVTSPGDIWLCVVSNDGGGIGCDTSYPDGRSYRYSDGEYYQYNNLDFMVRLRIKGTILEHDVLVESIDNPYRYIAPAKHSAVPRATVKNAGANTETFTTVCLIDSAGINVYTAYQEVCNLQSNSVARVAFPAWSVGNENSIYHMTVYTELSGDLCSFNDTISKNMTASYTEEISYNLGCVNACMTFVMGHPSDVLGRITPSAYPAQIKQMRIFLNNTGGNPQQPVELRVYSDINPADFYNFEPGSLKWSGIDAISLSYGYHTFDISDEIVVIDSLDGEVYCGYLYGPWSNVYLDDTKGFIYPERFGMRWAGGYSVEDDKDYIISAVVRYTEDGSLSGIVTEASSRAPITNAQIIIGSRIGYSNEFGEYLITDLPSGDNYTVSCDAADQGYNIAYAYNVEIIADDTTNVDFSLTSPSMIVEPGVIDTTIGTDDSLVTYITVSNDGNGPLDYSITTGQSQNRGGKAEFSVSPKISNSKSINNSALIESNVSGWYTVANRPINKGNRLDEWYTYGDINSLYWITWPAPERVTYFNPSDFGLEYPFYITKLSHWFYEHPSYPWDDATFHFKVYAEDGVTLLYESGDIEAQHMVEIVHELSGPVAISSGGFYFGVAPVSSSGYPSSCADNVYTGDNHSYYGSPGNWTLWSEPPDKGEYLQSVYLTSCNMWITTEPASGTVEPGSTDTVAVTCYTTGVDPGITLNGNILFSSYPDVGCDTVNVTLTVVGGITGDFNSDGYVDLIDLQLFGDHWHFIDTDPGWDSLYNLDTTPDPQGHQIINFADLQVFGDHWHEGTPPKSIAFGKSEKGPNENAGIRFDLNATTYGNQNQTSMDPPSVGDYISADVYAINVHNLDTYEFEVNYNQNQLEYITTTPTNPITHEENILTSNGGEALGWMVDTSTPGVLSIAYTLSGTDTLEAPEGEGLIADIVFQALTTEQDSLTFGNVYFCNSFGEMDIITDKGTANLPVNDIGFDTIFKENRLENYPNPFRAQTTIFYAIKGRKKSDEVELKIYNVRGQLVKTIEAKNGKTVWNAEGLSSGIYFYKISCGENSKINKMLLIK